MDKAKSSVIKVCTFWWTESTAKLRYQYSAEDVRAVRRAVSRNLTQPHEFVVVTDNPNEFKNEFRTEAIEKRTHIPGTRFAKLMLFRKGCPVGERILYLDLDCCITGNLDHIVNRTEPLVLWRNPNFGVPRRARYNTSIMLLSAGCRPDLYDKFDPQHSPISLRQKWGGTDQAWVSEQCSPNEAHWTDADGVYGAGRLGDVAEGVGTALPDNAKIVFFPGNRRPTMPHVIERHPWLKDYQ